VPDDIYPNSATRDEAPRPQQRTLFSYYKILLLLGILVASGGIEATAVWPMEYIKVSERSARILDFFLDMFLQRKN
jgi:hypothetical protein